MRKNLMKKTLCLSAAAGLLIRRRVRTAGTARSAGDKQD